MGPEGASEAPLALTINPILSPRLTEPKQAMEERVSKILKIPVAEMGADLGPIINVEQFAVLIGKRPKTVQLWIQKGRLAG